MGKKKDAGVKLTPWAAQLIQRLVAEEFRRVRMDRSDTGPHAAAEKAATLAEIGDVYAAVGGDPETLMDKPHVAGGDVLFLVLGGPIRVFRPDGTEVAVYASLPDADKAAAYYGWVVKNRDSFVPKDSPDYPANKPKAKGRAKLPPTDVPPVS